MCNVDYSLSDHRCIPDVGRESVGKPGLDVRLFSLKAHYPIYDHRPFFRCDPRCPAVRILGGVLMVGAGGLAYLKLEPRRNEKWGVGHPFVVQVRFVFAV